MSNAGIARMPRTSGIILRIVRLKGIECVPVTDMGKFAQFSKERIITKKEKFMNTETQRKIREWEAERDRNLRIHCPLVAAKFQRWIDKINKKENESINRMKGNVK